jgi:2-polyprenyl-6-methoxyphenol hydroxylase-like FAD-dependent oxidoreductase
VPVFDVIVVGARCAGAPTAMLLARRGYRVLLVDRARFPSDTLSTHFLQPRGAAMLARWGLLERLRDTGCPAVNPIVFDAGAVSVTADAEPVGGVVQAFCPRRTILDQLLVEAAVEAGCELRAATAVDGLLWDGDRVLGIRSGGREPVERARVVVGADGMRSRVARLVDATVYDRHRPLIGVFYTYWQGVEAHNAEFHVRDGRHILVFPTHHDLTCIFVSWRAQEFDTYRADVEGNYRLTLELVPDLAARVRQAGRVAPFRGTNALPNFYRTSQGPGWALAGDAGHHKDPTTGMGMSDAFRDAELLADAIDLGLSGGTGLTDALRRYQEERDRRSRHLYQWALRSAALDDPAPLWPFLEALNDDPPERARFMSVITGTVPYWEVLGQANQRHVLTGGRGPARGGP